MADAEFDAVVVGGGLKGLICSMYLTKYGGMSVGIFERRHEIGGGQAFSDADAPGFIGDPHCTNVNHMYYYSPIQADFPDCEEKGLRLVDHKATIGVITRENPDKCCVVYNMTEDPTQEKTAKEIARYATERDAETYLKLWNYA
ncbi:MAG: NAD(P)-binding protein, partial [Desulfobacteraceae bacterium]|nr:NAD(P)-binding protein [Desulfobacteraceae bacterium]